MTRSVLSVLLVLLAFIGIAVGTAIAAPGRCGPLTQQPCWEAENGKIGVGAADRKVVRGTAHPSGLGRSSRQAQERAAANAAFCRDASANTTAGRTVTQEVAALCRGIIPLPVGPGREDVVRAFRELPLYRGVIRTEPRLATLVNLETDFWCGDEQGRTCEVVGEGERTVTLLGRPVRIRPKIVSYSWSFGDGTAAETTGRAQHTYAHAGKYTVTLTLTWTADYAVGTGALQPIDDTTTTTSEPRILPVREAQTVIVGEG